MLDQTLPPKSPDMALDFTLLDKSAFLVGVYFLALLPRYLFVALLGDIPLIEDEIEYDRIAWNLISGQGFSWFFDMPCTYRSPGYPVYLAFIYSVFGPDYYFARIFGTFVIALVAPLTAILGYMTVGEKAARVAAVIVALYVPLIFYSYTLMSENLVLVLLLASSILVLKAIRDQGIKHSVFAGICLAAAIYTRSSLALLVVFLLPVFWLYKQHSVKSMRKYGVLFAVVLICLSPWVVRNYLVTDKVMFLDSRLGVNMQISFNKDAIGDFNIETAHGVWNEYHRQRRIALFPEMSDSEYSRWVRQDRDSYIYRDRVPNRVDPKARENNLGSDIILNKLGMESAIAYIFENPLHSFMLSFQKLSFFWGLEQRLYIYAYMHDYFGELSAVAIVVLFAVLLIPFPLIVLFAVFGGCFSRLLTIERLMLLTPIVYFSAMHSVIFGGARYHFVVVPMLALLAADGWYRRNEILSAIRSTRLMTGGHLAIRAVASYTLCAIFIAMWIYGQSVVAEQWYALFQPGANHLSPKF